MIQVEKLNALPFRIRKCIRTNVPLSDLEEMVIRIGVKEGLSILKASLTSSSALTNGLSQFIRTNLGAFRNI
ncbi:hypothetical protein P8452_65586 [Trifolium repens]|nr:hypothetical protein P8452_65586 [Trifolium repens]